MVSILISKVKEPKYLVDLLEKQRGGSREIVSQSQCEPEDSANSAAVVVLRSFDPTPRVEENPAKNYLRGFF